MSNEDLILNEKLSNLNDEDIVYLFKDNEEMNQIPHNEFQNNDSYNNRMPADTLQTEQPSSGEHIYTEKELRKLGRRDLFSIIFELKLREEKLTASLAEYEEKLKKYTVTSDEAGSIAEAAMSLNHIFEVAQNTADDYIKAIEKKHLEAEQQLKEAYDRAHIIIDSANQKARIEEIETKEKCERLLEENQQEIEKRWYAFQNNVNRVINAHKELRAFMK